MRKAGGNEPLLPCELAMDSEKTRMTTMATTRMFYGGREEGGREHAEMNIRGPGSNVRSRGRAYEKAP